MLKSQCRLFRQSKGKYPVPFQQRAVKLFVKESVTPFEADV